MNARSDASVLAAPSAADASAADVRRVVGLRLDPAHGVPQVVLKGAGPLADELLRRQRTRAAARGAGDTSAGASGRQDTRAPARVVRDEALLQSLYRLPLEAHIGPELFHVVAVILAHVFALEAEHAARPASRRE